MPPGRSSRRTRERLARIEQVLEHVEQRHRIEASGREARVLERDSPQIETTAPPELDRGGVEIDSDGVPARLARRLHDEAGAAADVEVPRRAPIDTCRCSASGRSVRVRSVRRDSRGS